MVLFQDRVKFSTKEYNRIITYFCENRKCTQFDLGLTNDVYHVCDALMNEGYFIDISIRKGFGINKFLYGYKIFDVNKSLVSPCEVNSDWFISKEDALKAASRYAIDSLSVIYITQAEKYDCNVFLIDEFKKIKLDMEKYQIQMAYIKKSKTDGLDWYPDPPSGIYYGMHYQHLVTLLNGNIF